MILYWFCFCGCVCILLTAMMLCIFADTTKYYPLYVLSYLMAAVGIVSGAATLRLMGVI